ncbi:MAG TPA: glycosyltransferase family 4 protein [Acidimicrobiales bacterium]|nr:glycosyltransferase family 4 protein [Acidimicrobiales bacterium]
MRVLFVSENISGHRTFHGHIERALHAHPEIEARFIHVPPPRLGRRIVSAAVPGLGRLDLDFQPARAQFAAAAIARRLVRDHIENADVVHWYTANSALLCLDFVKTAPSVVSLDMTNAQNSRRLPYRYPTPFTRFVTRPVATVERRVYEHADAVVTKSEWAAASVRTDYGIDAAKVRAHAFGIVPGPRPRFRPPQRPTIVFVGTTLERKGGWRLLDIWRTGLRERSDLVLVTKDRVPAQDGLRVISDVNVGDSRIEPILDNATVFAFPSTMDASPHAVFEAMARALPVVVCHSGGMPEQVVDGRTGFVARPDDDTDLADALSTLVGDTALARRMGEAGRALVEERFDLTKQIVPFLEVLRDASGRGHRSLSGQGFAAG